MDGRVRIHRPNHNFELTVDASFLLRRCRHEGEGTDTFTVQAHVLRERLAERDLVALRHEVAGRERVRGDVARREALVGHVEEGEELLLLDNVGDLLPLLLRWVNTGRVVRARVEKDDCVIRRILIGGS